MVVIVVAIVVVELVVVFLSLLPRNRSHNRGGWIGGSVVVVVILVCVSHSHLSLYHHHPHSQLDRFISEVTVSHFSDALEERH